MAEHASQPLNAGDGEQLRAALNAIASTVHDGAALHVLREAASSAPAD